MWIRLSFVCAAFAALSACSATPSAPDAQGAAAPRAAATYPSEHNQLRELGWQ